MWLLILIKKLREPSIKNFPFAFLTHFTLILFSTSTCFSILKMFFPNNLHFLNLTFLLKTCFPGSILMALSMGYHVKRLKIESLIITKNLQFDLSLAECFYKFLGYFSSNEPLILKSSLLKKKICAQVKFQERIVRIDLKFSEMAPQKTNLFIIVSSKDRSFKNSDLENVLQDLEKAFTK